MNHIQKLKHPFQTKVMETSKILIKVKDRNGNEYTKLVEYNSLIDANNKRKIVKKELNKLIKSNNLKK